ncbi:BglG family transcription antiterminator [Bacillus massiliglaciei]|uniref:BglG family transcription antiterminator n=1 Tax=Bacillus massiliglaciei TaxID=1816693 RepID=UPI000A8A4542|nr:PRD domain-containing protein [Bacillus massiliglaciei]
MFITSREKAIIELIIKTSGKHTVLSIATFLNVSVRTIQRDLKAVEKILHQYELKLARNPNEGLVIEGKNEQIFRLVQQLMGNQPVDQTPQEKRLLVLLALLQEEAFKIQALASAVGVSAVTLTSYLDDLEEWLHNYRLRLIRKRGVGVEISGSETDRRKALAHYFLLYFNEELIERLFWLEKGKVYEDPILHYFSPDYLLEIDRLVQETFNNGHSRLADGDYIGLIVHICIMLQRTEAGFLMGEADELDRTGLENERELIREICSELENRFSVNVTERDIDALSVILRGSKYQEPDVMPYDSVVLGQMTKNIIQSVSSQMNVDLTKDFPLFQGLLAHMEPSIFRIKQHMALFNPLKDEIKRKYPVLFMAVKNSVEKEFKDDALFPDDEIAFIVLHFGSALVMREEGIRIKALVVCPTGIGTSKMLASRIKREFPEIDSVEIRSIKDIQRTGSLHQYDVIISTVRLPFTDLAYVLVNPLLTEDNIVAIKGYLQTNIERFTKNALSETDRPAPRSVKKALTDRLEELDDVRNSIRSLTENFRVFRMPKSLSYQEMLVEMVKAAEAKGMITDSRAVMEALKEREQKGGLGIQHTGMALFHTRHEAVKGPLFQVAHLEEPCLIKGMDGNDMMMKSLLLMLAPQELRAKAQEIMSLISTSLIESSESIMTFSSSNEELILSKLEAVFLDYLQTTLKKE